MEILRTDMPDVKIIKNFFSADARGSFTKTYNADVFEQFGIDFSIKEQYYSVSDKDVIRGMHFQSPPCDHHKLVHVIKGSVLDVVVDIRRQSKTYGKVQSVLLKGDEPYSLYIPKGFAHGFKSLEDGTVMLYNVSTTYSKENDCGIKWDSIDFDWQVKNPIISQRDALFESFEDFVSPF